MVQYRVKWPNGRESVLSEEAHKKYEKFFGGTCRWYPHDFALYKALLAAEKVEDEDEKATGGN